MFSDWLSFSWNGTTRRTARSRSSCNVSVSGRCKMFLWPQNRWLVRSRHTFRVSLLRMTDPGPSRASEGLPMLTLLRPKQLSRSLELLSFQRFSCVSSSLAPLRTLRWSLLRVKKGSVPLITRSPEARLLASFSRTSSWRRSREAGRGFCVYGGTGCIHVSVGRVERPLELEHDDRAAHFLFL